MKLLAASQLQPKRTQHHLLLLLTRPALVTMEVFSFHSLSLLHHRIWLQNTAP